jgi:hypothetical protein
MELTAGMKVLIEGERNWSVGTIVDIRPPGQLPEIDGGPAAWIVRSIMAGMRVDRVAIISHAGNLFCALQANGTWWDLTHQRLAITPLAQALSEATSEEEPQNGTIN